MQMLKKISVITAISTCMTLGISAYADNSNQCDLSLIQINPKIANALQNTNQDHYITICGVNYLVAAAAPCQATAHGSQCESILIQAQQANPLAEQGLDVTYTVPELGSAINAIAVPVSGPAGSLKNYFG